MKLLNPKSRHISLRNRKVRELVIEKKIKLEYIEYENCLVDSLTKYLNGFVKIYNSLFPSTKWQN